MYVHFDAITRQCHYQEKQAAKKKKRAQSNFIISGEGTPSTKPEDEKKSKAYQGENPCERDPIILNVPEDHPLMKLDASSIK